MNIAILTVKASALAVYSVGGGSSKTPLSRPQLAARTGDIGGCRTDIELFDHWRGGCIEVHDQCDDGRARLRDSPELRSSDRRPWKP
jgi:hypothetical protein